MSAQNDNERRTAAVQQPRICIYGLCGAMSYEQYDIRHKT